MKKYRLIAVLIIATITSGILAQERMPANMNQPQMEQVKSIRDKYADNINELRKDIRYATAEQEALFASKTIDENAILNNVEKIGKLRGELKDEMLTMHKEIKEVCPSFEIKNIQRPRHEMGMRSGNQRMNDMGLGLGAQQRRAQMQGLNKLDQTAGAFCQRPQGRRHMNDGMRQGKGNKQDTPDVNNETEDFSVLSLKEEQLSQLKEIKRNHFWDIQDIRNELSMLRVECGQEPDLKSMKKVNDLEIQLAKQEVSMKIEQLKVLTEDQRITLLEKRKMRRSNRGYDHRGNSRPNI